MDALATSESQSISINEIETLIPTTKINMDDILLRLVGQDFLRYDMKMNSYRFALEMLKKWRLSRGA